MVKDAIPHVDRARLDLTIPLIPSSLNEWTRAHWSARNRERKAVADVVHPRLLLAGCRSGRPLFREPVRVTLTYHVAPRLRKQRIDLDNMAPKHIIDALRGWVFPDDGPEWLAELVQRVSEGAGADTTTVAVEPVAGPS